NGIRTTVNTKDQCGVIRIATKFWGKPGITFESFYVLPVQENPHRFNMRLCQHSRIEVVTQLNIANTDITSIFDHVSRVLAIDRVLIIECRLPVRSSFSMPAIKAGSSVIEYSKSCPVTPATEDLIPI